MSPFLKVVTNKYFATVITLVLAYMLTKVGYAEIWPLFGSANQLLSVLPCSLCSILKENKTSGLHALDPDGIHDGSYLHSTWHDHHKAFKGTGNNRAGSWKHLTACICSITADPWCTGSDPGREETA